MVNLSKKDYFQTVKDNHVRTRCTPDIIFKCLPHHNREYCIYHTCNYKPHVTLNHKSKRIREFPFAFKDNLKFTTI